MSLLNPNRLKVLCDNMAVQSETTEVVQKTHNMQSDIIKLIIRQFNETGLATLEDFSAISENNIDRLQNLVVAAKQKIKTIAKHANNHEPRSMINMSFSQTQKAVQQDNGVSSMSGNAGFSSTVSSAESKSVSKIQMPQHEPEKITWPNYRDEVECACVVVGIEDLLEDELFARANPKANKQSHAMIVK